MKKKIVGLIYGGKSPEHEVSKMTAKSIRENIDRDQFDVIDIFIDKEGKYDYSILNNIDVAFLAVHGPNCEDGKLQKLLGKYKIKYTGSGAKSSKINMDKISQHRYFNKTGLKVTDNISFGKEALDDIVKAIKDFGLPVVIKPNNGGSSIGITKVENESKIKQAVVDARKYDTKIIVERAVSNPREIEIAILGNDELIISNPGEVISNGKFYSYETKYFKPFDTTVKAKNLSKNQIDGLKEMAKKAYRCTNCRGYARVDFFIDKNGEIYINEINTLPGFTKISMFPKLMQEMGISYKELITKIIKLALE